MCEHCPPPDPKVVAAYEELEAAVKKVLELEDRTYDIMTDWVLITAQTQLHKHVDSHAVGWTAPPGQSIWKTKGLMQETLDNLQAYNAANEVHHFGE